MHMLYSIEVYQDSGRVAAEAANEHNTPRHQFERDRFNRMVALEKDVDKPAAKAAFEDAYRVALRVGF
jgi:hypothetical protein